MPRAALPHPTSFVSHDHHLQLLPRAWDLQFLPWHVVEFESTCSLLSYLIGQVGPARFRAPGLLFRPDLIGEECEGIHEVGSGVRYRWHAISWAYKLSKGCMMASLFFSPFFVTWAESSSSLSTSASVDLRTVFHGRYRCHTVFGAGKRIMAWACFPNVDSCHARNICGGQMVCPGHKTCFWQSSGTFLVSARRGTMLNFATDVQHRRTKRRRHNASLFCQGLRGGGRTRPVENSWTQRTIVLGSITKK